MTEYDYMAMKESRIFIGEGTRRNLKGMYAEMRFLNATVLYISWGAGISRWKVDSILMGRYLLNCGEYLSLADFMGWNVRYDPNYIWYHVIYSPEEIARRLRRLNITSLHNVKQKDREHLKHIFNCFYGQYPGTPHELRYYLRYIRMQERGHRFIDPIRMED